MKTIKISDTIDIQIEKESRNIIIIDNEFEKQRVITLTDEEISEIVKQFINNT